MTTTTLGMRIIISNKEYVAVYSNTHKGCIGCIGNNSSLCNGLPYGCSKTDAIWIEYKPLPSKLPIRKELI